MDLINELEIILITYNRKEKLKNTLKELTAEKSPVKDLQITILDNNSTDGTQELVEEVAKVHQNISYIKNKYNVGLSGNIAKAIERNSKNYLWILADDDKYDWSNWSEVETAINNAEEVICVSRYVISEENKNKPEYQLLQMTFVPSIIFKTSIFTDTVMRNVFDNIFTLFPHLYPIIPLINQGKKIYIIDKAIVFYGMDNKTDCSYIRGQKREELCQRTKTMSWIVGYANVCSMIKDEDLKCRALMAGINSKYIHGSFEKFCIDMCNWYDSKENWMQIFDVYLQLDKKHQKKLYKAFKLRKLNKFNELTAYTKKIWNRITKLFQ